MSNAALKIQSAGNVIPFEVLRFPKEHKPISSKARPYNGCHKPAGESSEVYAFRTEEEIKAMIDVFDNRIEKAHTAARKQVASRNKLLFLIGINVGLRASDLVTLRYSFFYDQDDDGTLRFKEFYTLQPKKQRKAKKFVKLFFNNTVKKALTDYIEQYPFENIDDYLFYSQEGDGAITTCTLWRIIKGAAKEAHIEQSIGSHSLRKSFGFWVWHEAEDKDKALVVLSQIFQHSSVQTTRKYIGITDDEIKTAFESIELGLNFL